MARYRAIAAAAKLADKQIATLREALERRPYLACASCQQRASKNWTYCPYCGAQERVTINPDLAE